MRSFVEVEAAFTLGGVDGSTFPLRQIAVILPPLAIDVANGFGEAIVLVVPLVWLPDCVRPRIAVWPAVFPCAKVVGLSCKWASAVEQTGLSPFFCRQWKGLQDVVLGIPPAGPLAPCRAVDHVVVLVGVEGQVHVGPLAFEDVFEAAPWRVHSSVFGPHECFCCFDVAQFSAVLEPAALKGAPLGGTVPVLEAGGVEVGWDMAERVHGVGWEMGEDDADLQSWVALGIGTVGLKIYYASLDVSRRRSHRCQTLHYGHQWVCIVICPGCSDRSRDANVSLSVDQASCSTRPF